MNGYKITEKDIQTVINFLKREDPNNANRQYALEVLEILHATIKTAVSNDPDFAEELYKALKQKQRSNKQKD
ncbi:MAG: hypothetical protein OXF77_00035 [Thaumarchaeota archaeon]|nr:hypothetical protein [Nitrososphaerota archaeon]